MDDPEPVRKKNGVAVWLLGLIFWASQSAWPEDISALRSGVVKITAIRNGKTSTGTGFIVRSERDSVFVVTASHVIEGDPQPRVTFFRDAASSFSAKVIAMEGGDPNGLAVMTVQKVATAGLRALDLERTKRPRIGQPVTVLGFPPEGPWATTSGTVGGFKGKVFLLQAPLSEGNSGAPVISDGTVWGVVTQSEETMSLAIASPIAHMTLLGWGVEPEGQALPPVTLRGSLSNSGWMVNVNIADEAAEIFYKIGTEKSYRSTGITTYLRPGSSIPQPGSYFSLPENAPQKFPVSIKYVDLRGQERGPYEFQFDMRAERIRDVKEILETTANAWLHWKEYDGKLLIYFSHLLSYRDAMKEIRYSIDNDTLSEMYPMKPWDDASSTAEITSDTPIHIQAPSQTRYVAVKLTFRDGTVSEPRQFPRPKRLDR